MKARLVLSYSRWVQRESNLLFTLSSDKDKILGSENSPGGLVSTSARAHAQSFCVPTAWECGVFDFFNEQVGVWSPRHLWLSAPLGLHFFE